MGIDQRRSERKAISVEFRVRDGMGAGELLFQSVDLSAGGTFLESDLLLEAGEVLTLEFMVPGQSSALQAQAKVVWVRRFPKGGERSGMGIQFVNMSEADRAALEDALKDEL